MGENELYWGDVKVAVLDKIKSDDQELPTPGTSGEAEKGSEMFVVDKSDS